MSNILYLPPSATTPAKNKMKDLAKERKHHSLNKKEKGFEILNKI
jgi:hypothetical protein